MEFKKAHPKNTKNFENSTNRFKWSKNNEFLGSLNNVKPVMRREIDDSALEVATIKPFAQENKDQNNDETSTRYSNIASRDAEAVDFWTASASASKRHI